MKKHTILIADDHELVRSGLSLVLGYQKDFTVVGAASNGTAKKPSRPPWRFGPTSSSST